MVKNLLANARGMRDSGLSPELGRSPGGEHGNHSSILGWRIPGTGEPGRLPSMGSCRVGHDRSDLAAAAAVHFSSLIPRMSTFTLVISCLTTSNFP